MIDGIQEEVPQVLAGQRPDGQALAILGVVTIEQSSEQIQEPFFPQPAPEQGMQAAMLQTVVVGGHVDLEKGILVAGPTSSLDERGPMAFPSPASVARRACTLLQHSSGHFDQGMVDHSVSKFRRPDQSPFRITHLKGCIRPKPVGAVSQLLAYPIQVYFKVSEELQSRPPQELSLACSTGCPVENSLLPNSLEQASDTLHSLAGSRNELLRIQDSAIVHACTGPPRLPGQGSGSNLHDKEQHRAIAALDQVVLDGGYPLRPKAMIQVLELNWSG